MQTLIPEAIFIIYLLRFTDIKTFLSIWAGTHAFKCMVLYQLCVSSGFRIAIIPDAMLSGDIVLPEDKQPICSEGNWQTIFG